MLFIYLTKPLLKRPVDVLTPLLKPSPSVPTPLLKPILTLLTKPHVDVLINAFQVFVCNHPTPMLCGHTFPWPAHEGLFVASGPDASSKAPKWCLHVSSGCTIVLPLSGCLTTTPWQVDPLAFMPQGHCLC